MTRPGRRPASDPVERRIRDEFAKRKGEPEEKPPPDWLITNAPKVAPSDGSR